MNNANRKLHFLVVAADKYPLFRVDLTVLFGKEIVGRGHVIDWILQSEKTCRKPYQTTWDGGRAWIGAMDQGTRVINRIRRHLFNLTNDLRLFGSMRDNNYDFVQIKDKFLAPLLAIAACKLQGLTWVYWLSYPFPESFLHEYRKGVAQYPLVSLVRGKLLHFLLYRLILPRARHIFVQSEQMKMDVAAQGIPVEKMTTVPMGIDLDQIPKSDDLPVAPTKGRGKNVVFTGIFFKIRRLDFLIRVFADVLEKTSDAKLYMIGAGKTQEDENILVMEAKRLGILDSVVFTGFLTFKDMLEYVRLADVCVSAFYPSFILNSTSPTKLIEYMAMGKATVANDHPEQRQIITESGAGICVPYDEQAFADAVVELLRNPERAADMGRRGRAYVERHRSYKKIADLVEKKYQEIVNSWNP